MTKLLSLSLGLNVGGLVLCALLLMSISSESLEDRLSQAPRVSGNPTEPTAAIVERNLSPPDAAQASNSASFLSPPPSTSELNRRNWLGLRTTLLEAGWPEEDAFAFTLAAALTHVAEEAPPAISNQKYWQPLSRENQRTIQLRRAEIGIALDHLLGLRGPGILGLDDLPIPPKRAYEAALIQLDYDLMEENLHMRLPSRFTVPEDAGLRAALMEAEQRDLNALLSAKEQFEYQLRNSRETEIVRSSLQAIDGTEEEFRALMALKRAASSAGFDTEQLLEEQRELLGDERFRRYRRWPDSDYHLLLNITDRFELPVARADRVFELRSLTEEEAQRIRFEKQPEEDRAAALRRLEAKVHENVLELLGPDGLEAFQERVENWIQPR